MCVQYNSNISLIKSICYPLNNKFKNAATKWGNTNESNGRTLYIEKLKNNRINFSVTEAGLVINSNIPYMGASADGIINCNCCGKGCLEIKCPYSLSQGNDI